MSRPETPGAPAMEPLVRVATRQAHARAEPSALRATPSISTLSVVSPPQSILDRLSLRDKPGAVDDADAVCGFLKRSTGPWSLAWWSDAIPKQRTRNEPGRGWRPFKAVLAHDTLFFYKVPSALVPEVRATFQVRSSMWPSGLEEDEETAHATSSPSTPQASALHSPSVHIDSVQVTTWDSPAQHPELCLVRAGVQPASWTARIERATGAALAHELVFGTQRAVTATSSNDSLRAQDKDERTFLHIVFYALGTSPVSFDVFLKHVRLSLLLAERLGCVPSDLGCTRRIAAFLDLLLWKRPQIPAGHTSLFFHEADQLTTALSKHEPNACASIARQMRVWHDASVAGDLCVPTNWVPDSPPRRAVPCRALQGLYACWSIPLLLSRDPFEIAQQIQVFHADRLAAFVRVPITAYRMASAVTESLLRSLRFDASRPHWLTHLVLRQLLVDEAPERQGSAERAPVLLHWAAVARASRRLQDHAAWAAICAALCSRAAACIEALWHDVPPGVRFELAGWATDLAGLGWVEGVHTSLSTQWADDPTVGIPFLGNAGLAQAAAPHLGAKAQAARMEVQIAAQEPEFNRVRALAQRMTTVYPRTQPVECVAPIAEYQCLFQRLAQHEYPLHTGVTDYLGSAVLAGGLPERGRMSDVAWADGAQLPLFPTLFPAALPGAAGVGAWPALPLWTGRYDSRGEHVRISESLQLRALPDRAPDSLASPLVVAKRMSQDMSNEALAGLARLADASHFAVEIAAASTARIVDVLALGAAHLVVRSPLPDREPPEFRVLSIELDRTAFCDAILLSRPNILSSTQLLEALRLRWDTAESASREMQWHARNHVPNQYPTWNDAVNAPFAREATDWAMVATIRGNILATLERWMAQCPHDFLADPILFEGVYAFLCDARAECDASLSDIPELLETLERLRTEYPKLAVATMAAYSYAPRVSHEAGVEWTSSAELYIFLESVLAPVYAALGDADLGRAALSLSHVPPAGWCAAAQALASQGTPRTFATLVRLLPAPSAQEDTGLLDTLPLCVRELCEMHETVRAWLEAQVATSHDRARRLAILLETAGMARAHMAKDVGGLPDAPLPLSMIESVIADVLVAPAITAQHAVWEAVSERIPALAMAIQPSPVSQARCTPDIYWMLAWLASMSMRQPVHASGDLVSLAYPMMVRDMARVMLRQRAEAVYAQQHLARAYARLGAMRDVRRPAVPPFSSAPPPALLVPLLQAYEAKVVALAAIEPPAVDTHAPPPPLELPRAQLDSPLPALPAPSRTDALLAAVPTARVSSVFSCKGALIRVWPYERHPYVFEMVLPNGTRCALKVPDYASFCHWLARLQCAPHVRLDGEFDAGEYAAQVSEHQGRANVAALFQVSLRELYQRYHSALPPAIECLLQEIEARGVHEQGIYRISGSKQAVSALQKALRTQPMHTLALRRVDVHVIASTIKLWLRELPEPVVPYTFYHQLVDTEEISDQARRVRAMSRLVRTLPKSHYYALERFAAHLSLVARNSKVNLMAPHNIGLVFGSTLLSPPPAAGSVAEGFHRLGQAAHVVKILVVMHRHIFPEPAHGHGLAARDT